MDRMPIEILCKILSYLNTYDVLQFCEAYECNCFLKKRSIIRSVDLSRRFELKDVPLYIFLTTSFSYQYIESLNINYMYWIPATELRMLIRKLENLEVLRALGTELSLLHEDLKEYIKLKKLAISAKMDDINDFSIYAAKDLTALKSLCICIIEKGWDNLLYNFLREISQLEELWICVEVENYRHIHDGTIVDSLKNLKKIVIKQRFPFRYYTFEQSNLVNTFECRRHGPTADLIFEKISNKLEDLKSSTSNSKINEVERALQVYEKRLHDLPYGPSESKQFHINNCFNGICFQELNFCGPVITCNPEYTEPAIQILKSENSRDLKKLRLRTCMFKFSQLQEASSSRATPYLEGLRQSSSIFSDDFKGLTELEIEACPECNESIISAYSSIQKFTNLRRLNLDVPQVLDGLFLKEVFMKCQSLESLYLTCVVVNYGFMSNLYKNLKYAAKLKDFRFEHPNIYMNDLVNNLNVCENKTLLRIFINCNSIYYEDSQPNFLLSDFWNNNPQLIFLCFIYKKCNKRFEAVYRKLNPFSKDGRVRIVYICKSSENPVTYPTAHYDIIFNHPNVSVINIDSF